jgi:putative ABC transport system substrate-binding protein
MMKREVSKARAIAIFVTANFVTRLLFVTAPNASRAATGTIPIVMGATDGDPVALGLAKSLSRPGGNVTGTQLLTGLSQKRLQLLKQAFPGTEKVAVLADPKSTISLSEMPKAEMAATRIGLRLVSLAASTPAELRALVPAALSGSDGLLVIPDAVFWNNRATIIGVASKARVPAVYPEREYADDGAFPSGCWLRRSYPSRSQPRRSSDQRHLLSGESAHWGEPAANVAMR